MKIKNKIGWKTAAALVIANMIGTGVFTSLGFQLLEVQNTWSIIFLWTIGGIMALIGALVFAELGTHFKRSGGDYIFLSENIHPSVGYLYAWVSLAVGFSAPIAIAAMAVNHYLKPVLGGFEPNVGAILILLVTIAHSLTVKQSAYVQNLLTIIKLLFVFGFIGIGLSFMPAADFQSFDFSDGWKNEILIPGFSVSLVFVFYAYTGWNSAAYIVEEIDQPRKNLPKALILATLLVMACYILLQLVFIKHASVEQLAGKVEIATIVAQNLFGQTGVYWVSFFIAIQLIATISGYTWVGPRVTHSMAKDFKLWFPLSKENAHGIPVRAIWLNSAIALLLMLTGSFEKVLIYAGFVLQLMGTITIFSSLLLKNQTGFKTPFKPYLQVIYLLFSTLVLLYILYDKPIESLAGMSIIGLGLVLYFFDKKIN
ncbi:amino acid permease [Aquiflexum sp. TKW24L]|uniref:APC family permease n=1 Tax=Aquiflexum sp. TKW24L TaxID=2942212 RepID=UPI0020C060D4|nr:amino acid permease [Aquiflexum sp. TKW24L]MCL6260177.1 amino acid permease [Aquiflexum sp. TKW24L]